jgi:hypothetical protein
MDYPKRIFVLLLAAASALPVVAMPATGLAAVDGLRFHGAWARPAAPAATDAGYLQIDNPGGHAERLIGAQSPAAASVSIHESRMSNGVMTMRPVRTLRIPARSAVALAPGGLHLMMTGLKRPLRAGDRFPVTLIFARAGKHVVEFLVSPSPPNAPFSPMKM